MEEIKAYGLKEGKLEIELCGEIHSGNADEFYKTVVEAYKQTPVSVVFDGKQLDFIDSTALGAFVKILKTVKTDGNTLGFKNLQAKIKKLFVICSLDTIMEIA